jgi:hypothetical protein
VKGQTNTLKVGLIRCFTIVKFGFVGVLLLSRSIIQSNPPILPKLLILVIKKFEVSQVCNQIRGT